MNGLWADFDSLGIIMSALWIMDYNDLLWIYFVMQDLAFKVDVPTPLDGTRSEP